MINVAEDRGQFCRIPSSLRASNNPRGAVRAIDQRTGGRREIRSRFRSAMSPWIDRRQKIDIIRDELEERGIAVLRDRNSSRDYRMFA